MQDSTIQEPRPPRPPRRPRAPGQAALTPLLDTLFLLLFAVLASSDEKAARTDAPQEVRVKLPSVEEEGSDVPQAAPEAPVIVVIEADGSLFVDGVPDALTSAQDLAAVERLDDPEVTVEIRAHADARHAAVVEVLHELQQMGVEKLRFVATTLAARGAKEAGR